MRRELFKSNKELWKQMEERKRLNAAFSHDLRNPITVLKGSAKMLRNGLFNGELSQENAKEALSLIEEYVVRIETYVEAMSSVQRLEELQSSPKNLNWETLAKELAKSIHLITMNSGIEVKTQFENHEQWVLVDKAILFNVAENLIANALRYAKRQVDICLKIEKAEILLSIKDDGCGFTSTILKKGAQPFLRGGENNEHNLHFGMGLYVCRLLCEKHGGSLKIENISEGALVTANFNISKP
jgi:K+-sensing histidine kinase KdpD